MRVKATVLYSLTTRYIRGFWDRLFFGVKSWFFDSEYELFTEEEFWTILRQWRKEVLPELEYTREVLDCDDFAELFKVYFKKEAGKNAVGVAIGKYDISSDRSFVNHAWNIVYLRDYRVYFVEPQNGHIVNDDRRYRLKAVLV